MFPLTSIKDRRGFAPPWPHVSDRICGRKFGKKPEGLFLG